MSPGCLLIQQHLLMLQLSQRVGIGWRQGSLEPWVLLDSRHIDTRSLQHTMVPQHSKPDLSTRVQAGSLHSTNVLMQRPMS